LPGPREGDDSITNLVRVRVTKFCSDKRVHSPGDHVVNGVITKSVTKSHKVFTKWFTEQLTQKNKVEIQLNKVKLSDCSIQRKRRENVADSALMFLGYRSIRLTDQETGRIPLEIREAYPSLPIAAYYADQVIRF